MMIDNHDSSTRKNIYQRGGGALVVVVLLLMLGSLEVVITEENAAALARFFKFLHGNNEDGGPVDEKIKLPHTIELDVSVRGGPIRVWGSLDMWKKCKIGDYPDIPTRAFAMEGAHRSTEKHEDGSNGYYTIHMIQGSTNSHTTTGPNLFDVTRSCNVTWNKTGNANPSMFAGNEFLDSTVAFANGTVVALSHTEYPGDNYNNCPGPNYPYCWTVTTGMMVSYDSGITWQHLRPPPHHLVAAVPYKYNTTQLASGWGDPTNIMHFDEYYYVAMWNRNQVGLQEPGVCMMRTNALLEPSSWRGWNGSHYSVSFASPYNGTDYASSFDPAQHICQVLEIKDLDPTQCSPFGLVWSPSLSLFLMTWACFRGNAFYYTTSADLVQWSSPVEFYNTLMLPNATRKHVTSMHYPTLMDASAPFVFDDPNYSTIGSRPHLFWVSFGHAPHTGGRSVYATPLTIEKQTTGRIHRERVFN